MKKILFGILILSIASSFKSGNKNSSGENGKLAGAVTYKDYYYDLVNHADAGSEIYAINEADVNPAQYEDISRVVENFQRNKSNYSLARYNTLDIGRIIKLQDDYNASLKSTFNSIHEFMKLPAIVKASTNVKGNYTLSLRPGRYLILVISGSIKNNNIAGSRGNIDSKNVVIEPGAEASLNFNFEKVENILNMLLFSRPQEGC